VAPRDGATPVRGGAKPREKRSSAAAFVDLAARAEAAEPAFLDPVATPGVGVPAPEPPPEALAAPGAEPSKSAVPLPDRSPFAGSWVYAPQAGEKTDPGAYPAVYVEFLLAEESGDLVGSYRAEYKVPDK
jgi:hypothetical protein